MTCSEVHFENVTGLPSEEWITGHNKCTRSSIEAAAGGQLRDNDSRD